MNVAGRRWVRWAVPAAVAGVIVVVTSGALVAQASTDLPSRTAAQLLADIEAARIDGLSGTVVEKAALGLPSLPSGLSTTGGTSLLGLVTGSHTLRVWYAGVDRQRIALLESIGEADVFHDGTQLWQWDSNTKIATHTVLPAGTEDPTPTTSLTPQQAAERALRAIDPSTQVTTLNQRSVAGRAAYELVLTPRDQASRIGSVRISIDGQHKIPLGVSVFARDKPASPAFSVAFQAISFRVPDASNFQFTPPPGSTVKQAPAHDLAPSAPQAGSSVHPTVIGSGWTSILQLAPARTSSSNGPSKGSGLLGSLPRVSGSWGSGTLFSSALLTALFVDDGRIFVGAVDPPALYAAAGR